MQGVPLRLELGPRDIKEKQFVVVLRHSGEKRTIPESDLITSLSSILDTIQKDLKVNVVVRNFDCDVHLEAKLKESKF